MTRSGVVTPRRPRWVSDEGGVSRRVPYKPSQTGVAGDDDDVGDLCSGTGSSSRVPTVLGGPTDRGRRVVSHLPPAVPVPPHPAGRLLPVGPVGGPPRAEADGPDGRAVVPDPETRPPVAGDGSEGTGRSRGSC